MKPNLKLIKTTHRPVVDIYEKWRADIEAIDWEKTHTDGDKRKPVDLPDSRRGWSR